MKLFCTAISLLLHVLTAYCSDKIKIAEPDDWVKAISPKSETIVDTYELNSGFYYTLFDVQMNLEEEADFYHYSQKITSFSAVQQASQIMIGYDPSYQKVTFHSLIIRRKDKTLDRTKELNFELLNNEGQLISGVYQGDITAYALLDDIRKDDEIEYSFTIYGYNPIFEEEEFCMSFLNGPNPIDRLNLSVIYSNKNDLKIECNGINKEELQQTELGDLISLSYLKDDIPAVEIEETMAPGIIPFKYVALHSQDSWSDVQEWARGVFEHKKPKKLNSVYDEIFEENDSQSEKIQKLIDFVQNDIRYMAIFSGIGSHKPRHPDEIIESRYGDCKDKSNLLAVLLNKIGVTSASPALVNTYMMQGVENMPPSGTLFDHCIVYFNQDGVDYWIDPTSMNMGGSYKDRTFSYYKKALVLNGTEGLKDMNFHDPISSSKVHEVIDLNALNDTSYFKVNSTHKGDNSIGIRNTLEYYSLKDLSDGNMSFYSSVFSNLSEHERLQITDEIDSNHIEINEHYALVNPWTETNSYGIEKINFTYEPLSLYDFIRPMHCEKKNYPVGIQFPARYFQTTRLNLPDVLQFNPFEIAFDNEAFSYLYKAERLDSLSLLLTYSFETKTDQISPDDFQKVCKDLSDMSEQVTFTLSYPKNKPTNEELENVILQMLKENQNK